MFLIRQVNKTQQDVDSLLFNTNDYCFAMLIRTKKSYHFNIISTTCKKPVYILLLPHYHAQKR